MTPQSTILRTRLERRKFAHDVVGVVAELGKRIDTIHRALRGQIMEAHSGERALRVFKKHQAALRKLGDTSNKITLAVPKAMAHCPTAKQLTEKLGDREMDRKLERSIAQLETLQELSLAALRELAEINDDLDRSLR